MQKAIQTVLSLIAALLFFAGIGIIAYPSVNKIMVDKSITKEVSAFLERENPNPQISVSSQPESIFPTEAFPEGPKEHRALWEAMYAYNEEIHENHQVQTSNSGVFAHAPFTLSDYDLDSEVFGICKQSRKISQNSPESIPLLAVPGGIIRHKVYQSCVVSL